MLDCGKCGYAKPSAGSASGSEGELQGPVERSAPRVGFRYFRGTLASWDDLFDEAAEFATTIGRERLINISHSEDANEGVVTVWFWE